MRERVKSYLPIVFSILFMGLSTVSCSKDDDETPSVETPSGNENTNKQEAIDLGLPSGTKWASCNVGANEPEGYGGYYAWGETEEKGFYNESTYKYKQNGSWVGLGSDISGTQYDVARLKWGGNWRMPTKDEVRELIENCKYEWTTLNGVKGGKFTSKTNGNSIFLPAAGYRLDGALGDAGSWGYYWSSTQDEYYSNGAYGLGSGSGASPWVSFNREVGRSVRPVIGN